MLRPCIPREEHRPRQCSHVSSSQHQDASRPPTGSVPSSHKCGRVDEPRGWMVDYGPGFDSLCHGHGSLGSIARAAVTLNRGRSVASSALASLFGVRNRGRWWGVAGVRKTLRACKVRDALDRTALSTADDNTDTSRCLEAVRGSDRQRLALLALLAPN